MAWLSVRFSFFTIRREVKFFFIIGKAQKCAGVAQSLLFFYFVVVNTIVLFCIIYTRGIGIWVQAISKTFFVSSLYWLQVQLG